MQLPFYNGDGSQWTPDQRNTDLDTIELILTKENITYEPIDDYPHSIVIIPTKRLVLSFCDNDVIVTKLDISEHASVYDMETEFFEEQPKPFLTKTYSSKEERNEDLITLITQY